jgi:predicted RNase H-like nuclease
MRHHSKDNNGIKPSGNRCGATRKVIFKTERGALNRAVEIFNEDTNRKATTDQFRAYVCEYCGKYHLTTKGLRNSPNTEYVNAN